MGVELIFTIIGGLLSLSATYWVLVMRISLLEQKVSNHKEVTEENFAKLIKSIDKLEQSIEKLNDKIDKIK